MVFVVDSSRSIREANPEDGSYDNWALLLDFINTMMGHLDIDQTRVGLVDYSTVANKIFFLNSYHTVDEIKAEVSAMPYYGSSTNTDAAIIAMHTQQFLSINGDRQGVQNVAIVITDGQSDIFKDDTIPGARSAQRDGIMMFAIGITLSVDEAEVKGISSCPQIEGQDYWLVDQFLDLRNRASNITDAICEKVNKGKSREIQCFALCHLLKSVTQITRTKSAWCIL